MALPLFYLVPPLSFPCLLASTVLLLLFLLLYLLLLLSLPRNPPPLPPAWVLAVQTSIAPVTAMHLHTVYKYPTMQESVFTISQNHILYNRKITPKIFPTILIWQKGKSNKPTPLSYELVTTKFWTTSQSTWSPAYCACHQATLTRFTQGTRRTCFRRRQQMM